MEKHIIVGVHIVEREKHAPQVQQIFTQYGAQIRTRLGLPMTSVHPTDSSCSKWPTPRKPAK